MAKKQVTLSKWLQQGLRKISSLHFLIVLAYSAQIIVYDAWHVLTPEVVLWRWLAIGGLAVIIALIWYMAHNSNNDIPTLKRLLAFLIIADVSFACFNIYTQRGMASRAVIMFLIPIVSSGILLSRAALYATAAFCSAAYVGTAVAYFTFNFNEGYKSELYSETIFYSFVFFLVAAILGVIVRFGGSTNDA